VEASEGVAPIDQLLAALEACNRGLKRTSSFATRQGEEGYLRRVVRQSSLSPDEQEVVLLAARCRAHALQAARHRDLAQASVLLREARSVCVIAPTSLQCRVLCDSFQLAGEAYVEYCLGRLDEARDRLYDAMLADNILELEGGYDLLHLHRVQLVHNLVRIDARRGQQQEAVDLAWRLLAYLEGNPAVLPGPAPWSAQTICRLPSDLVHNMFDQIVAEIALIVADPTKDIREQFAAAYADHLAAAGDGSNCLSCPVAHKWLELKRMFIEDPWSFIRCCRSFFDELCIEHPVLWFATAVDLIAVCKDIEINKAQWLALDLACAQMPAVLEDALGEIMGNPDGAGFLGHTRAPVSDGSDPRLCALREASSGLSQSNNYYPGDVFSVCPSSLNRSS
jgi:hypothetical protein